MEQEPMRQFEIPADMRAMAEKSVGQARAAFKAFMTTAKDAAATIEGHAKATQAGAREVSAKALTYAERNVANTFAFADRVVQAKDPQEFVRLHTEFIQTQMKELGEQAKELGEYAAKVAMKSLPSKS
jgi:phasin